MFSSRLTIDQVPHLITNKRVLIRANLNFTSINSFFTDDVRVSPLVQTVNFCKQHNAKSIILMGHLGRPNGVRQQQYSIKQYITDIESMLDDKITFLDDCVGDEVFGYCMNANNSEIVLLENLRFHQEEEYKGHTSDINKFRDQLDHIGEIYINDAPCTCNRDNVSMSGVNIEPRAAGFAFK